MNATCAARPAAQPDLCSILAINPETATGVALPTTGDTWDYTSVQPLLLADIDWSGRPRK